MEILDFLEIFNALCSKFHWKGHRAQDVLMALHPFQYVEYYPLHFTLHQMEPKNKFFVMKDNSFHVVYLFLKYC